MVCALPWKTCNCPWFDYQHIEDEDRLDGMRVPYSSRHPDIEVIEISEEPSPPLARRSSTRTSRTRHRSERDRPQDRADGALAAHLQSQRHINPPNIAASSLNRGDLANVEVYGLGNSGGHHMNDSYMVRPVITSAAHTPVRVPAPRQSYFTSRRVVREAPAPAPRREPTAAPSSAMAGLSLDGTKRGANRVGTWLSHVQVDPEAINTQAKDVEVDDWRCDGTMIGID
jgi:ariadne-1